MVKYWLCVTNEKNWDVVKRQKIWGVSEKNYRSFLERTEIGDILVFYVKPKKLGGVLKIVSKAFKSKEKIFSSTIFNKKEAFPFRVRLDPVIIPKKPVAFEELVPKLKSIKSKKRWRLWRAYVRKAMTMISSEAYEIMEEALIKA